MEEKEVSLRELIDLVTTDIRRNLNYVRSESDVRSFEKYFEDMALFEAIGMASGVKAYADSRVATLNIATALIASGINQKGTLDKKEHTGSYNVPHTRENLMTAKRMVLNNQYSYLNGEPFGRKMVEVYAKVGSHREIIDPTDLVRIAIAKKEIESGFVEDYSEHIYTYLDQANDMWIQEKNKYIESGLTNKPYYKILKDLFETKPQHHYPLVTKEALEAAASFTYKLDNDLAVSVGEMQNLYRLNDASKLADMDVCETYSKEIKEVMKDYVRRNRKNKRLQKR